MTAVIAHRAVRFEQTIPRHLVHRSAISEVFITDVDSTGENTFIVGAQWPRNHSFFGPIAGVWHDPMLLVESIRQAGIAIAHEFYGVADGDRILWHDISFSVCGDQLLVDGRPADVVIDIGAHNVRRRGRALAGMHMTGDCFRAGHRLGSCEVSWSTVSPRAYSRLRGPRHDLRPYRRQPAAPVAPRLVGRDSAADVVLSESPPDGTWSLRVDTGHPVMFDHPVDHVPGMVAIEATRQVALLATGSPHALPVHGAFSFFRYIEHDEPCTIRAEAHPPTGDGTSTITVVLDQCGDVAVRATIGLRVCG